jgi:hypothetical protein
MVSSSGLLLLVYLTIATNFVGDMFPCDLRTLLMENVFAKHVVIFFATFFWVTSEGSDPESVTSFRRYVFRTCYLYLLFVLSCSCDIRLLLPALGALAVAEVTRAYTVRADDAHSDLVRTLERVRFWLKCVAFSMIVLGSVVYFATRPLSEITTLRCTD